MSAPVPRQNQSATITPAGPAMSARGGRDLGTVEAHRYRDVVILRPLGQLDRTGVERLQDAARAHAGCPVVVDLRDCVVTDPGALGDIADGDDRIELCFVSHRLTCRTLLARTGITSRFAVFQQLEDALQARTLATAGYGPGWQNS